MMTGNHTVAQRPILLVSSNFPPVIGGSSVVYDQLCRHAPDGIMALGASRTHETGLEWPNTGELDRSRDYLITRIPFLRLPAYRRRGTPVAGFLRSACTDAFIMLRVLVTLAILCVRHRVRVVCIGELVYNGWLVFPLRYILCRKVIIYTHGEEIWQADSSMITRLRGTFLRHSHTIISVSQFCKAAIVSKYGIPSERVVVLHNGVNLDEFHTGPRERRIIPERIRGKSIILSVARLVERKGHEYLLRAMPQILARVPEAHCLIVGEGPLAHHLQEVARDVGVAEHVSFLGSLPQDMIAPLYRAADVFVLPCNTLANGDTEGFGLVFLEANACGLPVVAGAAGGTIEAVIDGETGLLVTGTDPDEIANATCRILGDPELAARLAAGGWRRSQKWGWRQVTQEFLNVCRQGTRQRASSAAISPPDAEKITLPQPDHVRLLVTIDVEEQFSWDQFSPVGHRVAGVEGLIRFHDRCRRIGVSPVFLATEPMLRDPAFVEFFRSVLRDGSAELGVHLHAWNTTPFWETHCVFNSYQCNLPEHLERRKLESIAGHYEELFQRRPRIHRAGRWGGNWRTLDLVQKLGFTVDLSFCRGYSDPRGGGPDMTQLDGVPFWRRGPRPLLVIPASSVNYLRGPTVTSTVNFAIRKRWPALHAKLPFMPTGTPVRFSPEGHSLENLAQMAQQLVLLRQPVAVLTLHSTSLYGGGSPYAPTAAAAAALADRAIDALAIFIRDFGFRPATCGQLYDELLLRQEAVRGIGAMAAPAALHPAANPAR